MNKYRELSIKLWMQYRELPVVPAGLTEEQREAFRGVIGNVASIHHLKDTVSSHISEGYKEVSDFMSIVKGRLHDAEANLVYYEGVLYGESRP
jgi:hypothetical protein